MEISICHKIFHKEFQDVLPCWTQLCVLIPCSRCKSKIRNYSCL